MSTDRHNTKTYANIIAEPIQSFNNDSSQLSSALGPLLWTYHCSVTSALLQDGLSRWNFWLHLQMHQRFPHWQAAACVNMSDPLNNQHLFPSAHLHLHQQLNLKPLSFSFQTGIISEVDESSYRWEIDLVLSKQRRGLEIKGTTKQHQPTSLFTEEHP